MSGPLVALGSTNPAKLTPTRAVFTQLWPGCTVQGVAVPSGVPEQPIGLDQTRQGAVNRAQAARAALGAGWGVGLEGGVRFEAERAWLFGVVAVVRGAALQTGVTAELALPPVVAARLRAGEELGPIMDRLHGTTDIKRGVGTVGLLTGGVLSRADVWAQGLALTLAPFLNGELYGAVGSGE